MMHSIVGASMRNKVVVLALAVGLVVFGAVQIRDTPVDVLPERTRIALHVRMSFAALMPRRRWLDGHLVLARRVDGSRFRRIEVYSPRNVLHVFRLTVPDDVDAEFTAYLAEAYGVGAQEHLRRRAPE